MLFMFTLNRSSKPPIKDPRVKPPENSGIIADFTLKVKKIIIFKMFYIFIY